MHDPEFNLFRNSLGRLVFVSPEGLAHEVMPVRAFPITAAGEGISLISRDGHELAWIARLSDLPEAQRSMLESELADREFMPAIRRILNVSSFATPSNWEVETDRGNARLQLKGEDDIRRLPGGMLLIADSHGGQFLIRDLHALDRHSRRLLDRFL